MKAQLLIALTFFLLSFSAFSAFSDGAKMDVIADSKINWNGNYRIKLLRPTGWDDPGDYTHLMIMKGNKIVYDQDNQQWVRITNIQDLPKNTKEATPFMKLIPLSNRPGDYALAYSNWLGGSSQDELILLKQDKKGIPYQIFGLACLVSKIVDYNHDGLYDILVAGGRGESFDDTHYTYDPYLVYKQVREKGKISLVIDEDLSKKWSEENNFEWHGSKYSSDLRVDKKGHTDKQ